MNLSSPFILRPIMTTLVMIGLIIFGIYAYARLPVSALPNITSPFISITTVYPGADPGTMANAITSPIEKQCTQISGIKGLYSQSYNGSSVILMEFDLSKSITDASTSVAAAINRAMPNLPANLPNAPTYERHNPSDTPIIYIGVMSDEVSESELYDIANHLVSQNLSTINGVSSVDVFGSPYAVRAKIDLASAAAKGIDINEIAGVLGSASRNQAGGYLFNQEHRTDVIPDGQLFSAEDYGNVIIKYEGNKPVRLQDVADVEDSTFNDQMYFSYWQREHGVQPSCLVSVMKQAGANTLEVAKDITDALEGIARNLPPSVRVITIYSATDAIVDAVADVEDTLIIAFILVSLVIFLFLGNLRTTMIPIVVLPLSILGTYIVMLLFDFSIDILSLLAITLVIGFLVDDAIVVLENIFRHMEMGKSPMQASLDGSKEISVTIVSMTLCLSVVFIPMIFMPGLLGRMFYEFAVVIVVAVLFSGILALTLSPMLCSLVLRPQTQHTRVEKFANALFSKSLKIYMPTLQWFFKHTWASMLFGSLTLVFTVVLFVALPKDFIPGGGTGAVFGVIMGAQGTSPKALARATQESVERLSENPYVTEIVAAINIPSIGTPNIGILFANLLDESERPSTAAMLQQINNDLAPVSGIAPYLQPMALLDLNVGVSRSLAQYQYLLTTSGDPDVLYDSASALMDAMRKEPEFSLVTSDMQDANPQVKLHILRDRASTLGVSVADIENTLMYSYTGFQLIQFDKFKDQYYFIIEVEGDFRGGPESLDQLYVKSNKGQMICLGDLVEFEVGLGPLVINHTNEQTSVNVQYNISPGVALGEATKKIEMLADSILPLNVGHAATGSTAAFSEMMLSLEMLMIMAIFIIYAILGILYESFVLPFTVLSALPGAGFGALLTLLVFGETLSLYGYVGLIMLMGIVMKNGIMLVEFATDNMHTGKTPLEAITEACQERFRPILMTTIAAFMGAIPIAIGAGDDMAVSRRPLGLAIVGGLIFSQLITFYFTPVIYLYFERFEIWLNKKWHSFRGL